MTDGKPPRRPPPRRDGDDELVELPVRPIAPREPFAKLAKTQTETIADILALQRKMSLQMDGFGQLVNARFDIFHRELAMLRATVVGDHEPRIGQSEKAIAETKQEVAKLTPQQKAKVAAVITAKVGGWGTIALVVGGAALRALGKLYPEYGELIDGIISWVGL